MSRIAKRNRATKMALVTGETRACMVPSRGSTVGSWRRDSKESSAGCHLHPWRDAQTGRKLLWASIPGAPACLGPRTCLVWWRHQVPWTPSPQDSFCVVQPGGSSLGQWASKKLKDEGELPGTSGHLQSVPGVSLRRETGERCGGLPYVPQAIPKRRSHSSPWHFGKGQIWEIIR